MVWIYKVARHHGLDKIGHTFMVIPDVGVRSKE